MFGSVFQDLGKGPVGLFLDHIGDLAVGFLEDFHRCALADLFVVLVKELLAAVHHGVQIPLVQDQGIAEMRIGQRGNQPAVPVHPVCGNRFGRTAEVLGELGHIRVDREAGREAAAAHREPLHALNGCRQIAADLHNAADIAVGHADRAVFALAGSVLVVGVVGRSLVVGAQQIPHILHRHLAFRHKGPGDVVALRREVGILPVPLVGPGQEIPGHEPGAGRIVDMVGVGMGAEGQPRVELRAGIERQAVGFHELPQILRAKVLPLRPIGIGKVKMIQTKLVGHDDDPVIRHPPGNPVVAADGFQPPDLIGIRKGHAVGFVGAVLLEQRAGTQHPLPGGMNVGQYQGHQVLLANAAGDLLGVATFLWLIPHIGVRADDPGIAGDRLGGGHGHVGLVDAAGGPYAVGLGDVGAVGIAQGVPREFHLQVRDDRFVGGRLLPGGVNQKAFGFKGAVIVAGNDRGAVMAGFFANQNRGTGHRVLLFDAHPFSTEIVKKTVFLF